MEVEVGDKLGEIKRREREFNFGTGEWQQGSLLFSIIPEIEGEIRSRSPGYEIDCCSVSVKSGGNQRHSDSPTFCVRLSPGIERNKDSKFEPTLEIQLKRARVLDLVSRLFIRDLVRL